jgi:tetratricopeptide (TPR) repeat protein
MKTVANALRQGDYLCENNRMSDGMEFYLTAMTNAESLAKRSVENINECSHAYYISAIRFCDGAKKIVSEKDALRLYKNILAVPNTLITDNMVCHERIGDLYMELNEYEKALCQYSMQNALAKIMDEDGEKNYFFYRARMNSMNLMGHALYNLERFEEALDCFYKTQAYVKEGLKREFAQMHELAKIRKSIHVTETWMRQQLYC